MNPNKAQKGVALLMVLVVVTLLTALLTELAFSTMVEMRLVETFRDSTKAYYLAKGGINAGRMLLQEDNNRYDAYDEPWSQGIDQYPVADGTISIRIQDLDGRLSINALVKNNTPQSLMVDRCYRLFTALGLDAESDPAELTAALIDWLDKDNEPYSMILTDGVNIPVEGAEQSYYQSLATPQNVKNGPIHSIDELASVKGFTPNVINKIRPFVSFHNHPSVNINTASTEVLMSLSPEIDRNIAEELVEFRKLNVIMDVEKLQETLDTAPYSAFKTLANLGLLSTKSRFYVIAAEAYVNDGRRQLVAEVDKMNNSLIFFKVI